jgi:hypothetical protein
MNEFEKQNIWIKQITNASIEVKCWPIHDGCFVWNIYANIFESHKLFNNVEKALEAPFHGGYSYDQIVTYIPARGIQYAWQIEAKTLKIGCDYNHLEDGYFNSCWPDEGIPKAILNDCEKLIEFLNRCNNE